MTPQLKTPAQAGEAYAERGLQVMILHRPMVTGEVPSCSCWEKSTCQKVGKHPRPKDWNKKATKNPAVVRQWFKDWRDSNVGIVTGNDSGIFILDVDPRHGGNETLAKLIEEHGPLPATWEQKTGSGGRTIVFRHPGGTIRIKNSQADDDAKKLGPGLDVRGDGGQFVAAPSLHWTGNYYSWTRDPWTTPLADAPQWILDRVIETPKPQKPKTPTPSTNGTGKYAQKALENECGKVAMALDGRRNEQLNKSAFALGQLVGSGALDRSNVEELLADAAARCGLSSNEAARTIQSGLDDGIAQPRQAPEPRFKPSSNGKHEGNGKATSDSSSRTGAAIILDYFRERWKPVYRQGPVICCEDGEEINMTIACVPDSRIIGRLANATDAPKDKHGVNPDALPGFFKKWAPVAWGDLRAELPEEINAKVGDDAPAREKFVRLVREAFSTQLTMGTVIRGRKEDAEVTQTEKRSLIGWVVKFAKLGPWRDIRSLACWTRLTEPTTGELELHVAIRHELFAQVSADKWLRSIGATKFARLASKYGIGDSTENNRPHGRRAILLNPEFVSDMTSGIQDENLPVGDADSAPTGDLARNIYDETDASNGTIPL